MSLFSAPKYKEDPAAIQQRKQQEAKAAQEAQLQGEQATADTAARRMGTRGAQALFSAGYAGFPRTLGTANV
jgi:hypothetical protein